MADEATDILCEFIVKVLDRSKSDESGSVCWVSQNLVLYHNLLMKMSRITSEDDDSDFVTPQRTLDLHKYVVTTAADRDDRKNIIAVTPRPTGRKSIDEAYLFISFSDSATRALWFRHFCKQEFHTDVNSVSSATSTLASGVTPAEDEESFDVSEYISDQYSWKTAIPKQGTSKRTVKKAVSKKKRRFVSERFDLDLTYVTDRIIAMGFPSESFEAYYRNDMRETQEFFNSRHKDHYMIYNLCSEREYDPEKFDGHVERFPFDDHNCPVFDDMYPFCSSVQIFMDKDENNTVALHCKAGKGRTGLMICALLLHSGMWDTAEDVLKYYGYVRTHNQKGVTIPSQIRWVNYYEIFTKRRRQGVAPLPSRKLILSRISTSDDAPVYQSFTIRCSYFDRKYSSKNLTRRKKLNDVRAYKCGHTIVLQKDCRFQFNKHGFGGKKSRAFSFWLNTDYLEGDRVVLTKAEIDKVNKEKKCKDFWVQLQFQEVETFPSTHETPEDSLKRLRPDTTCAHAKAERERAKSITVIVAEDDPEDEEEFKDMEPPRVIYQPLSDVNLIGKKMFRDLFSVGPCTWNTETYQNCFEGRQAVMWMAKSGVIADEEEAESVCQELLDKKLILVVPDSASSGEIPPFIKRKLYRFAPRFSLLHSPSAQSSPSRSSDSDG
eukprot:247976_1